MRTVTGILVGTMFGALLFGCGGELGDDRSPEREALEAKDQCAGLDDDACAKKAQCVLEQYCDSGTVSSSFISSNDPIPEPTCESACVPFTEAKCNFLEEKQCGKRDDCQWICLQLLIGCPDDMPDCGVRCGCHATGEEEPGGGGEEPGIVPGTPPILPEPM